MLHRPPLKPKNCDGWLVHAPGATTLKVSSGDEVATRWLPSSLARSSPASHAGSKGSNILQHRPFRFRCKPAPLSPPRELNTPLECCESCAGQYPHLPTVSRTMRTSQFPKIAKFQLFLMNWWFNVINSVAISSPLDILLVGAPGACTSQLVQFFGLRGGVGDVKRSWR